MYFNPDIYPNILKLIGKTPIIKLKNVASNYKGTHFAKWEAFNPGHSNKDRIALHIIESAEKKGLIDNCLLYTSPSPRDLSTARMPSSA